MRKTRTLTTAALLAACALALSACGSDGGSEGGKGGEDTAVASSEPQKKGGVVLETPFEKPDLTLTDTKGEEYDLIEETKGEPVLLYFGYTHCPDVCPLTMSNIAVAKSKLTPAQKKKLRVVFVTSDPKRDDPKELGSWLRGQDPSFVGLTGDFDTIQAGAKTVGVSIEPSYKKKNGDVVSTHGAQLLAFSPKDDKAHVLYTEGNTGPEVLEKELPRIIKGENP
ncbi:SCO family protein [Streptomyces albidus (ex Kaewkla and Franco 2022)]|uniref:SCO family protein n=1 Tax=Streptomyces albidus (ex Kaewkla and Franco 2022) TaxID=722709 RepID=UPI0015EFDB87|nr:SCO family protein [Streptomyces albidus (ex Kaewkla and Franco 2022)]